MNELTRRSFQICLLAKYFLAKLLSLFCKKETIFLICERGSDARDNAFVFFEYIMIHHPEIKAYYIITKDSPDRAKLDKYGDVIVKYRSFKNMFVYCRATHLISTHVHGYHPEVPLFNRLEKVFNINKNKYCISLKHGITKDYLPNLLYTETKLDLLVCGAKPEYDYMKRTLGYPPNNLQYTGFCRFDRLFDYKCKQQILIMPTWRSWLNKDNFKESLYFKTYSELLTNETFATLLADKGIEIIFYPHHELQPYVHCFKKLSLPKNVIIADKYHYDVQQLLKESLLLITDYSSVFFDFAYMYKPIAFYQFDKKQYRENHYAEGYFRYDKSFGPVLSDQCNLISFIKTIIDRDFKLQDIYLKVVDEYFPMRDPNNCARVYEAIINLKK